MYVCCVKYFAFRLRLLLCLYYDTAYFNWIGVRAIGSRCHHSKFILSVQTTTNVHDRNRDSTTTLSLAITLPWLTLLQLTD